MRQVRGFNTLELQIKLTYTLLFLGLVLSFAPAIKAWREGIHLSSLIENINEKAQAKYAHHVMKTRCLGGINVSMVSLGLPDKDSLRSYSVAYVKATLSYQPPKQVKITVGFPTVGEAVRLWSYIESAQVQGKNLVIYKPIEYQPNRRYVKATSGCFQ
ncbi:hypothetical protein VNTUMSATTG_61150 (plasmid) [Vibrio nigripulchritudo]|uniref:hypothetical protein n=1 Tax=Vibrio nigripulchritudo TaxID=28173 RepID=UPI00190D5E19|nr:hypothetical protein [Vibrio nigripulchritudo]BCL74178.1 hypothetical protein VNTUMSATTG_61150 [Vibrio nigripulchritudo]